MSQPSELLSTEIHPMTARMVVAAFLLVTAGVGIASLGLELTSSSCELCTTSQAISEVRGSAFEVNDGVRELLEQLETDASDGSLTAQLFRPSVQRAAVTAGLSVASVKRAPNDALVFTDSLDHVLSDAESGLPLTRRPEDPAMRVVELAEDLAWHGTELIVVAVPPKPAFTDGGLVSEPLATPGYHEFLLDLKRHAVPTVDPLQVPVEGPRFLLRDTHWTPDFAEATAHAVADLAASRGMHPGEVPVRRSRESRTGTGDLADRVGILTEQTVPAYAPQPLPGEPDVLVIGDSFVDVFESGDLGWGEGAGFSSALAYALRRPVLPLTVRAGGAAQSRDELRAYLASGPAPGLVVWVFADRSRTQSDWPEIRIPRPGMQVTTPQITGPVTGTVLAASAPPQRDAPYGDQLGEFELSLQSGTILVRAWTMRGREVLPAAHWAPGAAVALTLTPWSEVDAQTRGIARSRLDSSRTLPTYLGAP